MNSRPTTNIGTWLLRRETSAGVRVVPVVTDPNRSLETSRSVPPGDKLGGNSFLRDP